MDDLEPRAGTYALLMQSARQGTVRIGRLGVLEQAPGHYIYVGSALGPGGLRSRVGRHRRRSKKRHWHIDHLRARTRLEAVWVVYDPGRNEHVWAEAMRALSGASVPLAGFGASDCGCETHLFHYAAPPSLASFRARLRRDGRRGEVVAVEPVAPRGQRRSAGR